MTTIEDEKRHIGELQRDFLTVIAQIGQLAMEINRLGDDVRKDKYPERTTEVLCRTRDAIDYLDSLSIYLKMSHDRIADNEEHERETAECELELLNEENRRNNCLENDDYYLREDIEGCIKEIAKEHPQMAQTIREKMKDYSLQRYGIEDMSAKKSKSAKEKIKNHILQQYGNEPNEHKTWRCFLTEDDILQMIDE